MRKETVLMVVLISLGVLGAGYFFASLGKNAPDRTKTVSPQVSMAGETKASPAAGTTSDGIQWQTYSQGTALARDTGKHIFLYFWADW